MLFLMGFTYSPDSLYCRGFCFCYRFYLYGVLKISIKIFCLFLVTVINNHLPLVKINEMDISIALKKIRKETTTLSQTEFAGKLGISQTYLSQIENGHKIPSMELIAVYGELTKIPLSVILWMGLEEKDVKKSKTKVFRELKPVIDNLIKEIIF